MSTNLFIIDRYYDLLLFTKDQDTPMDSMNNLEDSSPVSFEDQLSEDDNVSNLDTFNNYNLNKEINDETTVVEDTITEPPSVRYKHYFHCIYLSNKIITYRYL